MRSLIRSELLKLRTLTMTRWLFGAMLLLSILDVGVIIFTAGPDGSLRLGDPDVLARAVGGLAVGEVILLVLGVLILSQEFRFGTATATFLAAPRRARVLGAKVVAVAVTGAAFAIGTIVVTVGFAAALIRARGGRLVWDVDLVGVLVATVFVMAVFGVLGLGLGALIRNQIAAIVGAIVWLFIVEQLLIALRPSIGRWTPGGATAGAVRLGRLATTRGPLLPPWAAGLVLLGYAAALVLIGARRVTWRDVTESR